MKTKHHITLLALLFLCNYSIAQIWTTLNAGNNNLIQIDCASPDIVYVAGNLNRIKKTTNGGLTWTDCFIGGGSFDNSTTVEVIDANTVYAALEWVVLYKSTDGGINWVQKASSNVSFKDLFFTSSTTGFGVGTSSLTKTTNSYSTWTSYSSQISLGLWESIDMNGNLGVIVGQNGRFAISTNGGSNWNSYQFTSQINLWDVAVISPTQIQIVGANGTIFFSNNSGASFNQYTGLPATTETYYSIAFDENYVNGFIVGTNGTIAKTTNGAISWTVENAPVSPHLYDIAYASNSIFYACGVGGTVIKYTPAPPTSTEKIAKDAIDFCLYPNPTTDAVSVNTSVEMTILSAILTDINGKTIKTWETPLISTNSNFVLGDLPAGTYYLTLNIGGQFVTKVLVKQ